MWLPICPPPVSAAHASTRFQTSKNVKHVDARSGGGDGRDAYHRPTDRSSWGLALSFRALLHPGPPSPSPLEEKRQYRAAPRPLPVSPSGLGEGGAAAERAPAGLGGEPLARGPADFLLISFRKLAPCASLRTALGRGDPRRVRPPRRGAGEGHPGSGGGGGGRGRPPGFLGRCQPLAARWNFELRSGPSPAPAFLQEVERFVGWGLKGGWLVGWGQAKVVVPIPTPTHTCSRCTVAVS